MHQGFHEKSALTGGQNQKEGIMPWPTTKELDRPFLSAVKANDFVAAVSRQRRIAAITFLIIFGAVIFFGLLFSDRYEAQMEILVEQGQIRRAEPVVTSGPDARPIVTPPGTAGDEALNSEIALLRSQSVLMQVVKTCGLDARPGIWGKMRDGLWAKAGAWDLRGLLRGTSYLIPLLRQPSPDERTVRATRLLASKLRIEALKMSDVIQVSYRSNDPQLAAQVLNELGTVYLKEHALAHHPPGDLQFFEQETAQARDQMNQAEQKLVAFTQQGGVASGQEQLDDAIKRLSDVQAQQGQTQATLAGTEQRLHTQLAQSRIIPPRQTTELKSSDSAILLQQLKSSLLNLQMRRTELLTKYEPTYPLVQEVDQQIAEAQAALNDAEKSRVQERTTDRDPDYEMVREDVTRSTAEAAALRAQNVALDKEAAEDQAKVQWLQQQATQQQDLMRDAKSAEQNYLLLLQKEQEARISNQLDEHGILNVSIVQRAMVPVLPVHSAFWYLAYGSMLGLLCAFATAAGADRMDPTLRTPDEVEMTLQTQVLAAFSVPSLALPSQSARERRTRAGTNSFERDRQPGRAGTMFIDV
jgi:uncharacterized protein involved in exopolysaccharide biosynthesis